MLFGTLDASLLGNLLTGKGTITAGEGTIIQVCWTIQIYFLLIITRRMIE